MKFGLGEEWKELKKFEKLSIDERSIVFYAENRASMNHFRGIISELTEKKNFQICYVTSIKNDPILTTHNENIKSFFIGDGVIRTKFFMTLKAKTLIMDMPDLETYHIKRSKVSITSTYSILCLVYTPILEKEQLIIMIQFFVSENIMKKKLERQKRCTI